MDDYRIRKATHRDRLPIRRLIWKVGINPFRLHWENFVVATSPDGCLVGCGQLKPHGPGTIELASIAVEKEYRHLGIAHAVIGELIAKSPRPLYLVCLPKHTGFYRQFGFSVVASEPLPRHFARLARFGRVMRLFRPSRATQVMRLEQGRAVFSAD